MLLPLNVFKTRKGRLRLCAIDTFTCLSCFIAQRTNQYKWMVNEETRALIEIPAIIPFSTKALKNKEINRTCKRERGLSRSVDVFIQLLPSHYRIKEISSLLVCFAFIFRHRLTFFHYIDVYFTFGLLDCVRYNEDFIIYRGSLYRGSVPYILL